MIPRSAETVLAAALILLTIEVGVGRTRPPTDADRVSLPVLGSGTRAGAPPPSPSAPDLPTGAPAPAALPPETAGTDGRPTGAPAAPTKVLAVPGDRSVALSWRPAPVGSPVFSWLLLRAPAEGGAWRTVARLPASCTTYLDRPLPNCVPCKYLIYAVDQDGTRSLEGADASARPEGPPPAPPRGLAGLTVGASRVRLSWRTDPDQPIASMEVYRAESAGDPGRLVAVIAPPQKFWIDELDPQAEAARLWPRFYSLRARDHCGRLGPPCPVLRVLPRSAD